MAQQPAPSAKQVNYAKTTGFTVVEVMIVLAIAGLIFGLIFAAIPALQRVGHNNSRRTDVANILSAYSHYELSNSGDNPPDCSGDTNLHEPFCNAGPPGVTPPEFLYYTKLNYYNPSAIAFYGGENHAEGNNGNNTESVSIFNYSVCTTGNGYLEAVRDGAGYRDVVAIYDIETSNGPQSVCEHL